MALEDYEPASHTAIRLGIDPSQVRRYCEQGRMPGAVKISHRWLIPLDSTPETKGFGRPPKWPKNVEESQEKDRKSP